MWCVVPCLPTRMSAQLLLLLLSCKIPLNDRSQLLEVNDVVNDAANTHLGTDLKIGLRGCEVEKRVVKLVLERVWKYHESRSHVRNTLLCDIVPRTTENQH